MSDHVVTVLRPFLRCFIFVKTTYSSRAHHCYVSNHHDLCLVRAPCPLLPLALTQYQALPQFQVALAVMRMIGDVQELHVRRARDVAELEQLRTQNRHLNSRMEREAEVGPWFHISDHLDSSAG